MTIKYGWKEENLIKLNLPRWDKYNNDDNSLKGYGNIKYNSIFIMFTWREVKYGGRISYYYIHNILNLLNNEQLINNLVKHNIILYFTLHHKVLKYKQKFKISNNIKYIQENDISECLSKTNLFVTDFSSIIFDMIYRKKPYIIYIPDAKDEKIKKNYNFIKNLPLYDGVSPLKTDLKELFINNRWKPSCNILGIDNCPKIEDKGFGVSSGIKVRMSMRFPPLIDKDKAIEALKKSISDNTYFGAKISLGYYDFGEGAFLGNMTNKTKNILNKASLLFFGNESIFNGGGGSIPFISYFQSKYPNTDIICTGVVGSDSREHGPNENLNIEAAKKMICVLSYFLSEI